MAVEGVQLARSPVRRRRVLARGRLAHRTRVPDRGGAGGRSTPAPPRSTCPTRWATPRRRNSMETFTLPDARTSAAPSNVDVLGALPRRPRHGGRQQPARRARRRPPGRVHDQRHRRTRRQLLAGGSRDGAHDARAGLSACTPGSTRRRLYPTCRLVSRDHRHADPAQQGDGRRERLRARVRHPPARHAAASRRPTRSCGRRTSACRAPTSCSASTAAGMHSASGCKELGFELERRRTRTRVFDALQGAGRHEEGAVRRRHRGAGPASSTPSRGGPWSLESLDTTSATRRAFAAGRSSCGTPTAGIVEAARRRATARSMPRSRPSSRRPASQVTLRKFEVRSVSERRGRPGRGAGDRRVQRPHLPRHQRHHRHRRVRRAGLPRGDQPHRTRSRRRARPGRDARPVARRPSERMTGVERHDGTDHVREGVAARTRSCRRRPTRLPCSTSTCT